jgi:hypothetical protein
MTNPFDTKSNFTFHVQSLIDKCMVELCDSPKSRSIQINRNIGYYDGYCDAMGWDSNLADILKWSDLAHDETVYPRKNS